MATALSHRGPDAAGVFVGDDDEERVGFAHRRLSILDHEGGAQPMTSEDGRVTVVFNGQIYNHAELRRALEDKGHRFRSDHSDTEVLVHGYREWGAGLCERLNGMFAFCVVDTSERTLLLARDPMGQKPLYVATRAFFDDSFGGPRPRLAFSSELSALASLPGARRDISPLAFARYLSFDFVPDPDCVYDGVFKVPPGCQLSLSLDDDSDVSAAHCAPYWDLGFGRTQLPENEAERSRLLVRTLDDAVKLRMVADVPVGMFLSGGIDSSLVAALAARHTDQLETFSVAFKERSFDESSHARKVAQHLGTQHHEELLDADAMRDVLPTIADHLAEPFADHSVVPTYLLSRFARSRVTVALGGDGGDELFLGYPTFLAERLRPPALDLGGALLERSAGMLLRAARRLPVSHDNLSLDFKLRQALLGLAEPRPLRRHQLFLTGMAPHLLSPLLAPDVREALSQQAFEGLDLLEDQARAAGARDVWDVLTYGYAKTYMGAGVLQKVDRASMAVSLEVRAPMMDKRFVDLALSFRGRDKLKHLTTKAALKRAARGLIPDDIIDRPKKGFGMPVASWFAGPLRGLLEDVLSSSSVASDGLLDPKAVRKLLDEHTSRRQNHRKSLWALFMFTWWRTRVHGVEQRRAA